ncbi:MAG: hypothetical protein QMD09_11460, partial [Desulfatibacillaceae bacterium]|nr:hypothetical protein [Desulfatibacillaceae bacterium]
GLLDKIHDYWPVPPEAGNENNNNENRAVKDFLKNLKKQIPWIVIESGRGIPPQVLQSNEKFCTYSAIERAFKGNCVAKLELVKGLMELSRSKITWQS